MIFATGNPTLRLFAASIRRPRSFTFPPFGQTGPKANDPASDLTLFLRQRHRPIADGQVDDLAEAPMRPVGEQSAFIGGLAAACAGMHAALAAKPGAVIDVSIQEALAPWQ